ncbi:hypothetical protein SAMD00023353_4700910 [Rosellinia necatrix]|uniref:Uncharacterized protein n=1 Tax=Rosellinia necatrix TaxID=77044 RepID=A0A1S8A9W8_ROSNE|nr:hypothetical protein SAMD00023353_4700910 [Rosellinia necatrix]
MLTGASCRNSDDKNDNRNTPLSVCLAAAGVKGTSSSSTANLGHLGSACEYNRNEDAGDLEDGTGGRRATSDQPTPT